MNDQWTWTRTTVWGWTVGVAGGLSGGGQRGKYWDDCNRITTTIEKNGLSGANDDICRCSRVRDKASPT